MQAASAVSALSCRQVSAADVVLCIAVEGCLTAIYAFVILVRRSLATPPCPRVLHPRSSLSPNPRAKRGCREFESMRLGCACMAEAKVKAAGPDRCLVGCRRRCCRAGRAPPGS